ncbi:Porin B precursor [Planctomycetes bacterium Pan216]|uniref:Porin B n=1 Tax=Kolteria novifilia TaxID=2527975 RepID=A0A518AX78_9BACT|nr:Porin B precursor [Planctomycetes bacterium Pan216]
MCTRTIQRSAVPWALALSLLAVLSRHGFAEELRLPSDSIIPIQSVDEPPFPTPTSDGGSADGSADGSDSSGSNDQVDQAEQNEDIDPDSGQSAGLITRMTGIDKYGLNLSVDWVLGWNTVFFGGLLPGHWADQNIGTVELDTDFEKMFGWKGAKGDITFLHRRGSNATDLAGDVLDYNGYDNFPEALGELYELWIEQEFFDGKLSLLAGKVVTNDYFGHVTNAELFLGNDFETLPGMVQYMPQYPNSATGVQLFANPNEHFYAGFGVYDGRFGGEGINTGELGPQFNGYLFYVGETGIKYSLGKRKLPGQFSVGGWGQSGELPRWDGGTQDGTAGFYLIHQQTLWQDPCDDNQDIAAFLTWSTGDGRVNQFVKGATAGFQWTGPIYRRDQDVFGLGVVWGQQTSELGQPGNTTQAQLYPDLPAEFANGRLAANEWEWQTFYNIHLNEVVQLQPNLTYIHDPGRSTLIRDPLAFSILILLNF